MSHVAEPIRSGPVPVPTLDALAANPALAETLPIEVVAALYATAARVEAALRAHLFASLAQRPRGPDATGDVLLTVAEAAEKLGCSADWVYRHQDLLRPVRLGRSLRFAVHGLDDFIRARGGRRF